MVRIYGDTENKEMSTGAVSLCLGITDPRRPSLPVVCSCMLLIGIFIAVRQVSHMRL